ncbi:hypothetical protein F5882DRAFT_517889 [Hyaloscypha sp. PMI_1271]|nr:hypothetical protein F5882DRAFT_517889 [Hyaloscypha sp. PMI_1271]
MSSPFNEKVAHELNATKQVPAHIAPLTQDALVTTTGFLPRDHNLKFEDQSAMMGSSRKTERKAFGLPKEWMPRMNDISGEDTVLDVAHMACLQKSYNAGFGRHFYFLSRPQFSEALKCQVAPQILIIASTTLARTGMMWFLYKIFGRWNGKVRFFLIGSMVHHLLINVTMMLEIVLECGPNPYRLSNRLLYLHYAWDGPPEEGSAISFNAFADFIIAYIATYDIWQYSIIAMKRRPSPI